MGGTTGASEPTPCVAEHNVDTPQPHPRRALAAPRPVVGAAFGAGQVLLAMRARARGGAADPP